MRLLALVVAVMAVLVAPAIGMMGRGSCWWSAVRPPDLFAGLQLSLTLGVART